MSETNDNRAMDQARAQMESISKMIARLDLDWDRLAELRETAAELSDFRKAEARALCLTEEEREELSELEDIAEDCEDEDQAVQLIEEDPLEVCVRSGWTAPGGEMEAEEYMILLCTGGPAVRIVGDIGGGEAVSATLEYQDWGTPWTEYREINEAYLIRYADHFLGY